MDSSTIPIKEPAEKRLRKSNKNIQKRFAAKIRKLKENPGIHGKPLRGALHGYWKLYLRTNLELYTQ